MPGLRTGAGCRNWEHRRTDQRAALERPRADSWTLPSKWRATEEKTCQTSGLAPPADGEKTRKSAAIVREWWTGKMALRLAPTPSRTAGRPLRGARTHAVAPRGAEKPP